MFKLTEDELQRGFEAIEYHGHGALLPPFEEWKFLRENWAAIRVEIAATDLDQYQPTLPLRVYAPKNRATVRVVSQLHPVDLLIYTTLVLIVGRDIEANRIPTRQRRVFSYRRGDVAENRLYATDDSFARFQDRLNDRSAVASVRYVAIADIADFYPRIYQHRLENAVESIASNQRSRDVARVLVRKLIGNLSGNNSYGIPVGPYASRVLGEAVLIDIDSTLASEGIDFARWVDDYYIFSRTENEAQRALIYLAQRLYERHGLTLSALKTKILPNVEFRSRFDDNIDANMDERLELIAEISSRYDPYADQEIELTDEERAEFVGINVQEIVEQSLENRDLVDYDTLTALLRHPQLLNLLPVSTRKQLAEILLRNIEHLYPIAETVAEFFRTFLDLGWGDRKRLKTKIISSLLPRRGRWPPDYYMIWMLSVMAADGWREAPEFARILREHQSAIVRRAAALAIATNGNRGDAIEARDRYENSGPLERLAILAATRKLGVDERRHWKRSLQLVGPLEKQV